MRKKIIVVIIMTICLTAGYWYLHNDERQIYSVERTQEEQLLYLFASVDGVETEIPLNLQVRQMTNRELEAAFQELDQSLEKMILGDNRDLDHIQSNLNLPASIWNKKGKIRWEVEPAEYLSISGVILTDQIPNEGILGTVTAYVTCQKQERIYSLLFRLLPPERTEAEILLAELKSYLKKTEEEERTKQSMTLPETFQGKQIVWHQEKENVIILFPVLGVIAILALLFQKKEEEKKQEQLRQAQFEASYPAVVSESAILLDAGMTMTVMWESIAKGGTGSIYQEMQQSYYEIKAGKSENLVYEEFMARVGNQQYQKWMTLLLQNRKKGTKELHALLNQEVLVSMENRKNQVIRLSEKAGTKLLLPLMILLLVVVAILMIPAMWSFQI